jgi:pantoate--beta-alanine ligase
VRTDRVVVPPPSLDQHLGFGLVQKLSRVNQMTEPVNSAAWPSVVRTVAELRSTVSDWRASMRRVALVPTMGALHDGHLALVQRAYAVADEVVVSIFVNPTQFAPNEDLAAYPKTFESDLQEIASLGRVATVYAPSPETMYPSGFATTVALSGPAKVGLEDRFRPAHFEGVATVVAKLFVQSQADVAIFGEKDYQQLKVVTQMARDLDLSIEVMGNPTIRELDGLAMSSRNRFLSAAERERAPLLYSALQTAAIRLRSEASSDMATAEAMKMLEDSGFAVDYFEARHAETLKPITGRDGEPIRLLAAARLGTTRLIDNTSL